MPPEPLIDIVSPTEPASESAYLQGLQASLSAWVEIAKAHYYANSPSQLCEAVFEHYRQIIPAEFENTLDIDLLPDDRLLDEAAALHQQLQVGAASDGSRAQASLTLSQLRAAFLVSLRADWERRRISSKLFAPPVVEGQNTLFFDGFSFRNAVGKSFDDLVSTVDLTQWPLVQGLNAEQKRGLIKEKFDAISESTQYRIGMPQQALASALIRILKYQRKIVPEYFVSEQALQEQFTSIDTAWSGGEKNYPIQPRLLFALHLARSSGVEITTAPKLLRIYHDEVLSRVNAHVRSADTLPLRWVASYLAQWNHDGVSWNYQGETVYTEALLSLFIKLHDMVAANDPISAFAAELKQAGLLCERLVGNSWQDKAKVLLSYSNQRLLAVYGTPPRFDRRQAAKEILLKNGRSEAYLSQSRDYVLVGDSMTFSQSKFGNPVDEFLARADWRGIMGQIVNLPGGRRIHARTALQAAEETFNNTLVSDPWVVAKAKENLRMRLEPLSDDRLWQETRSISGNLKTETETHRAWVAGFEIWVNFVPVLGPLYNIEEGVRHQDVEQVLLGMLFLGLDALDIAMNAEPGGGRSGVKRVASRERVSPRESAHIANFNRAAKEVGISMESTGSHPSEIEITINGFNLEQLDGNVPAAYRSLATQVRNGQAHVKWQGYEVVRLQNENRIVPVDSIGGSYAEIDWYTAHSVPNAQLIHRDPATGLFRSGSGLKGGVGHRLRQVQGVDVEARFTVERVLPLLARATDMSVRNFGEIFDDCFVVIQAHDAASTFKPRDFYGKLYQASGTFRRLINYYDSAMTFNRHWKIVVDDAIRPQAPGRVYTDFTHNRLYFPADATIESIRYMSAGGHVSFSREQAYLHEMLHALTGASDPGSMLDHMNRGPIVYLTDKILSEAGYSFSEVVMYRTENQPGPVDLSETVEAQRPQAAHAANLENHYLDQLVDRLLPPLTRDTVLEGVKVEHRLTVSGVRKIHDELSRIDTTTLEYREGYIGKFKHNFAISTNESLAPGTISEDLATLVHFYGQLYKKSPTFRKLFDSMPSRGTSADAAGNWKFVLDKDVAIQELPLGRVAHGINDSTKKIYIFEDRTLYLSADGLKSVQFERKLTHEMVCIMTGGGRVKPSEAYRNRGPALYFTDKILKEAGFSQPQQIAAALAMSVDHDLQARLLTYQTSARRSAAIEDRYMAQLS